MYKMYRPHLLVQSCSNKNFRIAQKQVNTQLWYQNDIIRDYVCFMTKPEREIDGCFIIMKRTHYERMAAYTMC